MNFTIKILFLTLQALLCHDVVIMTENQLRTICIYYCLPYLLGPFHGAIAVSSVTRCRCRRRRRRGHRCGVRQWRQ